MSEENHCDATKLDKILDYAKENKSQATYALKWLCRCAFVIALGVAIGSATGTGYFIYDYFIKKAEKLND